MVPGEILEHNEGLERMTSDGFSLAKLV